MILTNLVLFQTTQKISNGEDKSELINVCRRGRNQQWHVLRRRAEWLSN